jgi:hypothetical protein
MDIAEKCAAFFFWLLRVQDMSIHVQVLFLGIWN